MIRASVGEIWNAIRLSGEFSEFFGSNGTQGPFSELLGISSCSRSVRTMGYRFNRYSISVDVKSSAGCVTGYGESDVELLAVQKAIAEGIERTAMILQARRDPSVRTSNGWAAHVTSKSAREHAKRELLERDAVLLHWLGRAPMDQVRSDTLPRHIDRWSRNELSLAPRYNRLKVFFTRIGEAPVATVVLHDRERKGFISHASGEDLETAIERAISETCRLADLDRKGLLSPSGATVVQPDDHALHYARTESIPDWFFSGTAFAFHEAKVIWREKNGDVSRTSGFLFEDFKCGPLKIARCTNPNVQNLFFGESLDALKAGTMNVDRIKRLTGATEIYLRPHCVA